MLQQLKVASLVLGFIVVLGAAYLIFSGIAEAPVEDLSRGDQIQTELPLPGDTQPLLITRTFSDGVHTVTGVVQLPNPCYFLDVKAHVGDGEPRELTLTFTTADEGGICIQVIDEREFEVEFEAPENIVLHAIK